MYLIFQRVQEKIQWDRAKIISFSTFVQRQTNVNLNGNRLIKI